MDIKYIKVDKNQQFEKFEKKNKTKQNKNPHPHLVFVCFSLWHSAQFCLLLPECLTFSHSQQNVSGNNEERGGDSIIYQNDFSVQVQQHNKNEGF